MQSFPKIFQGGGECKIFYSLRSRHFNFFIFPARFARIKLQLFARNSLISFFFRLASLAFNFNMNVLVSHLRTPTHMNECTIYTFLFIIIRIQNSNTLVFSSPEPKARVSYCHSAPSVVRPSVRPSVNFSLFRLLLQNRWMDFDETW